LYYLTIPFFEQTQILSQELLNKIGMKTIKNIHGIKYGHLLLCIVANLLFASSLLLGQNEEIRFKYYTQRDGLLSSELEAMTQDRQGFIWTVGINGVNRFNGYFFENWSERFGFPEKLYGKSILVDQSDNIWIGTEKSGVYKYTPSNHTLQNFDINCSNCGLQTNYINSIFQDSEGRIWMGTWLGIYRYDDKERIFQHIPFQTPKSETVFNYNLVLDISEAPDGRLWIGTWGGGLHILDPSNLSFKHFESYGSSKYPVWTRKIKFDKDGFAWIATIGNGLIKMNPHDYSTEQFLFFKEKKSEGYNRLLSLEFLEPSILWIGCEKGLIHFNCETKQYKLYNDDFNSIEKLLDKTVNLLFKDNHYGFWVNAGGLNYHNTNAEKFILHRANPANNGLINNEIYSFLELNEHELLISTAAGVQSYFPKNKSFGKVKDFNGIVNNMVKRNDHEYLFSKLYQGVSLVNLKNNRIIDFGMESDKSKSLLDLQTLAMSTDKYGNVWVGSLRGLSCLRAADNKWIHFIDSLPYSKGLQYLTINKLIHDENNTLWLSCGTRDFMEMSYINPDLLTKDGPSGIILDTTLYRFTTHLSEPGLKLMAYDGNRFWFHSSGVFSLDLNSGERKPYSKQNGLPSFRILHIIPDYQNGIWMPTDNGLSYLNLRTNEITNFYEEDGLQGISFSRWAAYLDQMGSIYLGGNRGFNIIRPSKIELNPYIPPVKLIGLKIFNQHIFPSIPNQISDEIFTLNKDISLIDSIRLTAEQNSFTLEFAALNFLYPASNQYAYKLEGVDDTWNFIGHNNFVSFNKLPEGKWLTFKLKAANNNGIWNSKETTLHLYIQPPFYNTLWFKLTAAALLLIIVVLFYKLRVHQLKSQKRELEIKVRERTQEVQTQKTAIERQNTVLQQQSFDLRSQADVLFKKTKQNELFGEMGRQITSTIDLNEIFKRIFELISNELEKPHLAIGRVSDNRKEVSYWEMAESNVTHNSIPLSEVNRFSTLSIQRQEMLVINDIHNELRLYFDSPDKRYLDDIYNSAIYIPLSSPNKDIIGVLVVKSPEVNGFNTEKVELLQNISIYIAIALENSNTYKQLEIQSEKLKELDRIKTKFYTNVSHEFRTPLSLVIGPTEEILKDQNLTVKQIEYLKIIHQNAKRLLRLVTQILDISRLEDGVLKLNVSLGNVFDAIRTIADSFVFIGETKKINFNLDINAGQNTHYFDKDKIEKIIYNLLHNAFKYSDQGQTVSLKASLMTDHNGTAMLQIIVSDTGIGIPAAAQAQIFKPYVRLENQKTRQESGIGIGLSLTKKLVELHKGSINLESSIGSGTDFTIEIPIDKSSYTLAEISESDFPHSDTHLQLADKEDVSVYHHILIESSEKKKRLLLVEDNQSLLVYLRHILWEHFEVYTAQDGREALGALDHIRPDIIISDVMMPGISGFELCSKIKNNKKYEHIPIVLLTAKSSDQDKVEGMKALADAYLTKPVQSEVLILTIKNLLHTHAKIKSKFESKLSTEIDLKQQKDVDKDFMRAVIGVLDKYLCDESLSIETFVSELGVSRTLLYEKVKSATGQSLNKLIKSYRMNYAAKLLLENHYLASELSHHVGFSDPKYFSKCFKAHFGKTPKDYLKEKLEEVNT